MRCQREALVCHYSVQKPMGRPRKRPRADSSSEVIVTPTAAQDGQSDMATAQAVPCAHMDSLDMGNGGPASVIDPIIDPSLQMPDMSFLDLLGPDLGRNPHFEGATPPTGSPPGTEAWNFDISHDPQYPPLSGSMPFPSVLALPSPGASPADPDSNPIDPALVLTAAITNTGLTPVTPPPPPVAPSPAPLCSCLANLYLALDSITRLPAEVLPAVCVARGAAKAAHDAIQCEVCFPPPHETVRSPVSTFQKTIMILGALLPSVADAYHRILTLVDAEAARAAAAHTDFRFSLSRHGGVWGTSNAPAAGVCGSQYEDKVIDPATWRLTVRALLRVDVYGHGCDGSGPWALGFQQVGLRDLVAQMDERSLSRHADIDALIAAGFPPPEGLIGKPVHRSTGRDGKEPQCRKVIAIAREAVEGLVIA